MQQIRLAVSSSRFTSIWARKTFRSSFLPLPHPNHPPASQHQTFAAAFFFFFLKKITHTEGFTHTLCFFVCISTVVCCVCVCARALTPPEIHLWTYCSWVWNVFTFVCGCMETLLLFRELSFINIILPCVLIHCSILVTFFLPRKIPLRPGQERQQQKTKHNLHR